MNLGDLLFDDGRVDDALAVHAGRIDVSVGELRGRARDIAGALRALDLRPGQPVGVMLPNGADVVAALFGVWRAGGVYVPLNPRLTAEEIAHVRASVQPVLVIADDEHLEPFRDLPVVLPGDGEIEIHTADIDPHALDPEVALVQFTSGTTGRPKAVPLEHATVLDLLDGVLAKIRGGRARRDDRAPMPNLVPVSLSLWAGIYQVLFATRVGAPIVVMDGFDTSEFRELVDRFQIRSTVLPPAAMAMLADDQRIDSLEPLRYVRSISAPLSPFQARRFKDRFGISVLNSYGQTEIGGEIVGWNAADSREFGDTKLGSVGRPHRGVQLRTDERGELQIRTSSVGAGRDVDAELADRVTADGWFRTGDIATIDDDGFVWIEGRVSDMINRGGLKVFPADVEEVLRTVDGVRDVAVVGVADDRLGEVPVAFVVGGADGEVLETTCREHLVAYKVPVRFERVDELPRNEAGKVLTRELAERATTADGRGGS